MILLLCLGVISSISYKKRGEIKLFIHNLMYPLERITINYANKEFSIISPRDFKKLATIGIKYTSTSPEETYIFPTKIHTYNFTKNNLPNFSGFKNTYRTQELGVLEGEDLKILPNSYNQGHPLVYKRKLFFQTF